MHSYVKVYAGSVGLLLSTAIGPCQAVAVADAVGIQAQQVVLLEERAEVSRGSYGPTNSRKLLHAAASGDAESVRRYLAAGADPDARNAYGSTALHYAALLGHADVVEVLLNAGADVRIRDKGGATPATLAAAQGAAAVLKRLDSALETEATDDTVRSAEKRQRRDTRRVGEHAATLLDNVLVAEVQGALQALGYEVGDVDGVMGSRTQRAIRAYQQSSGLRTHGWVDEALLQSLRGATARDDPAALLDNAVVAEVQGALQALGYDAGVLDGVMGSRTQRAIRTYQQARGLRTHGWVDEALLRSLRASR